MAIISAERFTALKAKVKAEMLRRNQSGSASGSASVESYGGAAYDYTTAPAAGKVILKEHIEKLTTPMRAINPDLVPAPGSVISESELANLEARITAWAGRSLTDKTATDCKSGCTGTCYSGCSGCTGCSGGCSSGCSGCSGKCGSGCTGSCDDVCTGCGVGCERFCSHCCMESSG